MGLLPNSLYCTNLFARSSSVGMLAPGGCGLVFLILRELEEDRVSEILRFEEPRLNESVRVTEPVLISDRARGLEELRALEILRPVELLRVVEPPRVLPEGSRFCLLRVLMFDRLRAGLVGNGARPLLSSS